MYVHGKRYKDTATNYHYHLVKIVTMSQATRRTKKMRRVDMWRQFDEVIENPHARHQNDLRALDNRSREIFQMRDMLALYKRGKRVAPGVSAKGGSLHPCPEEGEWVDTNVEAKRCAERIQSLVEASHAHTCTEAVEISKVCTACGSDVALSEMNFFVCTNTKCAAIYTRSIDASAEWRFYNSDDNQHGSDPARCGMPTNPLLHESSFACSVAATRGMSFNMRRIKKYTEWQSMPYREKARYDEFQTINIRANHAGLPKIIIDYAQYIHKRISDIQKFRGINRDGIIAASIYISCRKNEYPRTAKEIATIFVLDNTSATRGCKNAMNIMNELDIHTNEDTVYCDATPAIFIERYCSKLDLSHELTMVSKFVALKIEKMNVIPENTPNSLAAGIIYLVATVCGTGVGKRDVHRVSDISEVTINKCYKKLLHYQDTLVPEMIRKKYQSAETETASDTETETASDTEAPSRSG